MRTYVQSKAMAKSLRESLAAKGVSLSHSECLEIVARQFGFAEWNILATKLDIETRTGRAGRPNPAVEMQPAIPVIPISSLDAAREFYVDFLGFAFDWGGERDRDDQPAYAQLSRTDATLHLSEGPGESAAAILIRMSGLDAFRGELSSRNSRFTVPDIAFTPFDSRVIVLLDPFGNRLRFWENNPPGVADAR
jgi:catechol 2,3-dioxygenase-like lactoylglutathione lyase family enzyme